MDNIVQKKANLDKEKSNKIKELEKIVANHANNNNEKKSEKTSRL